MEYVEVTEIEHYTDRLFRFRTTRPQTFRFTAGEFIMLGMPDDDIRRAYSICSGPYDEFLEFYSIKVQDGPLTSRLQHIKPGDEIEINPKAIGTLTTANLELGGRLWLMATGTGIAPFMSIVRDPFTFEQFAEVHVTWTVRHRTELKAYHNELQSLPVKYFPTVTQDSDYPRQGRIQKFIDQGLVLKNATPQTDKVMICGSMYFNEDMRDILVPQGWNEGTKKDAGTFLLEKAFVSTKI